MPLVSILMTAFNRENYISEAIESVISSTYLNWELIISDDCSTDSTLVIARKYEKIDKRIKVFSNQKNLGDYPNRNMAASYAIGEFLMNVDSDDLIYKESISNCVKIFSEFKDSSFGVYYPQKNLKPYTINSKDAIQRHFFGEPFLLMGPGGIIIKRKYFNEIEGFPTKYGPANDGYFNLKAASSTTTIIIPFPLVFYRRHEGQELNNKYSYLYNNFSYLKDALLELKIHLNENQKKLLLDKNRRRFIVNILFFIYKNKDLKRTSEAIKRAGFTWKDLLHGIFH